MIPFETVTTYLSLLFLSMARMMGAFLIAPFFGEQMVTGVIRNICVVSLSAIIVPLTIASAPQEPLSGLFLITIIAKEVAIGLIMGVLVSIVFFAAEGMGSFIDTQRGASMGQVLDPLSGNMSSPFGILFIKVAILIFFLGGGFLGFLGFVYYSYEIWPIFSFFPNFSNPIFPMFSLEVLDGLMKNIVLFAAPVAILMFLVEFGLGMMNKFAPQLNVFSLSMPLKSGIAVFVIILYFSTLVILFKNHIIENEKLLYLLHKIIS